MEPSKQGVINAHVLLFTLTECDLIHVVEVMFQNYLTFYFQFAELACRMDEDALCTALYSKYFILICTSALSCFDMSHFDVD